MINELYAKDVNHALMTALTWFGNGVVRTRDIEVRGSVVKEAEGIFITVYEDPTRRVMLVPERDANPFFHLFESLWILAGRQDVAWLSQFNSNIANYSDDGVNFHAPYGYRLRSCGISAMDQISELIKLLENDRNTRRAVLSIWDPALDLNTDSKDIPCNDMLFFSIRNNKLYMTVCNRSNDMIWGAYGANVVQFSMLQEYIAGMVGVELGTYTQMSNNMHVYIDNPQYKLLKGIAPSRIGMYPEYGGPRSMPIMNVPGKWNEDLKVFMWYTTTSYPVKIPKFRNAWFGDVAIPMYLVWKRHKTDKEGYRNLEKIKAPDWRQAAYNWINKREDIKK